MGQKKKPKTSDSHTRSHQGQSHCSKCGKSHGRACQVVDSGCFRCGQTSHMSSDFPQGALIFFHCNQTGHKKANNPRLAGGTVAAPTPATLKITDSRQGKAEVPVGKSSAFQRTFEEARVAPDVITGMFSYLIPYYFLFLLMFYLIMYREFLSQWYNYSCPVRFGCYPVLCISCA